MLPIHLDARSIEDEKRLHGCELVLFGNPRTFGLSCQVHQREGDDVPGLVGFDEQSTQWGPRPFLLTAASVARVDDGWPICIAFGSGFVFNFDPESVELYARANPGDLVITESGLHFLAFTEGQLPINYLVNIKSGEATKQTNVNGSVIRHWSLHVESPREVVSVFQRAKPT